MPVDRRTFMRNVGIALAGFTTVGCRPITATCYVPLPPASSPPPATSEKLSLLGTLTEPAVDFQTPEWQRLRDLWYSLDALAEKAKDLERGQQALKELTAAHEAGLRALVETHQLNANVADEMQTAFSEAAWHVWRLHAPMTCYTPAPYPDYELQSRRDLQRQAELLEEMAKKSQIDEATVAEVLAAIKRDMAYMMLAEEERKAIREEAMKAGDQEDWPELEEIDLAIPDECREAAEILVALLLSGKQQG